MKESERARVVAGKYQLEKLLGQGGMGEVWVATDLARGGKIALKLLKVEAAESKEHRARFEREARIATSLVSPHITRVSDSGLDEDGTPFMAMELLSGQDLQQRIKTEKVLPITYVVRLAIQVGRGLHVAHAAGLVHRDLKPANIFLAQMGDEEIAKVLDFGIAKGNAQDASEFTTAGAMLGTASYMSPEQIRNAKTVDHRADLWALAVVLFRSLTGQFPFQETGFELFLAMMQDPLPTPTRITSLVPSLPGPLNVFFERSFLREIDQRYPNASAMVVGFCRAAGVTVPADVLHAADAPAPTAPISGQPSSGPVSMPVSGQPSSGPFGQGPPSPHVAHQEPQGLSGTLMLDSLPEGLGLPSRTPLPAAGRPGEGGGSPMELDPDEPDNAATLFYHPGASAPVEIPENKGAPGFSPGPPQRQVFTYPLDTARAAAADFPPAPGNPPLPSSQLAQASVQAQAPTEIAIRDQRSPPRGARATGLWILIVTLVLLAAVGGIAVVFLRP